MNNIAYLLTESSVIRHVSFSIALQRLKPGLKLNRKVAYTYGAGTDSTNTGAPPHLFQSASVSVPCLAATRTFAPCPSFRNNPPNSQRICTMTASSNLAFTPAKFYTAKICPFAQRASIALHELGLIDAITPGTYANGAVELVEIDLKNKPEWYPKVNPRGKVPALEITHPGPDGKKEVLIESALIAEFLLQANNSPLALGGPANAVKRYKAGLVVDAVSNGFTGAFYALLREKDAEKHAELSAKLLEAIKAVQAQLAPEGPYALGHEFSIADILVAPFFARLVVNEHYRGFKVPNTDEFARFNQYIEALRKRESIKATTAEAEYLINGYKGYAL
ncbi:glutathione S-transferase [Catenaria anguillulae PL171]|uniref:Glutathione S-transferase n=1 Tax=Catenaria anguillulae PL171 TaxID=765915 RepID=A0A1Y2I4Q1_9FUNG|nr:glutathione S-transferase [Catenaria anguillulae PL171]